jgi:hypothetical protein
MLRRLYSDSLAPVFAILLLSALTHLRNPIGFPRIYYDESIYAERSIRILEGLGPQDTASRYDHPYLGKYFSHQYSV